MLVTPHLVPGEIQCPHSTLASSATADYPPPMSSTAHQVALPPSPSAGHASPPAPGSSSTTTQPGNQKTHPTSSSHYSLDYLQTNGHLSLPRFIPFVLQRDYSDILVYLNRKAFYNTTASRLYNRLFDCFNDYRCFWNARTLEATAKPTRCYLRVCPICQRQRARFLEHRFKQLIHRCKHPMLWTLTLKNSSDELPDQYARITTLFKALRRQTWWTDNVRGGFWVFEATYNKEHDHWHPHLHMILDTRWLPHHEFKKRWLALTGDSYILHFHRDIHRNRVAHYVSKYLSKTFSPSMLPHYRLDEWLFGTKSIRFWSAFGCCHGKTRPLVPATASDDDVLSLGRWANCNHWRLDFDLDTIKTIYAQLKKQIAVHHDPQYYRAASGLDPP